MSYDRRGNIIPGGGHQGVAPFCGPSAICRKYTFIQRGPKRLTKNNNKNSFAEYENETGGSRWRSQRIPLSCETDLEPPVVVNYPRPEGGLVADEPPLLPERAGALLNLRSQLKAAIQDVESSLDVYQPASEQSPSFCDFDGPFGASEKQSSRPASAKLSGRSRSVYGQQTPPSLCSRKSTARAQTGRPASAASSRSFQSRPSTAASSRPSSSGASRAAPRARAVRPASAASSRPASFRAKSARPSSRGSNLWRGGTISSKQSTASPCLAKLDLSKIPEEHRPDFAGNFEPQGGGHGKAVMANSSFTQRSSAAPSERAGQWVNDPQVAHLSPTGTPTSQWVNDSWEHLLNN